MRCATAQLWTNCWRNARRWTLSPFRATNLYERVRALFFLYAIHAFTSHAASGGEMRAPIPFAGYTNLLKRRFEEAIDIFLAAQTPMASAHFQRAGGGYRALGFQTLADQVRRSVRSVRGNQWMFRTGHPATIRCAFAPSFWPATPRSRCFRFCARPRRCAWTSRTAGGATSSSWGWIPGRRAGAQHSIDLSVGGAGDPKPPVEAYFRVIDQPVLRLVSVTSRPAPNHHHRRGLRFRARLPGL